MRYLALRWLWWAFIWDMLGYCSRNPWRFFVALPLWLVSTVCIATAAPAIWRQRTYWNIGECWDAIIAGEVRTPPLWLFQRLDATQYAKLGERL
jgi:hypothetical protein